jgi:ABC-type lipoprotein export system ATPase subunit
MESNEKFPQVDDNAAGYNTGTPCLQFSQQYNTTTLLTTNCNDVFAHNPVPDTDTEQGRSSMFSKRKGLGMTWENMNFTVKDELQVLDQVSGGVESGEVCAIMGPSGSGKSSLLNVLAGRSATGGDVKVHGTVKVGGTVINPVQYRTQIAYVMQDDALMATTTPREALRFSASLRMTGVTAKEVEEAVSHTLEALGIEECADTFIGNALIKGISGGQRKRTSVGIELITQPSLLFLDEPTSVCALSHSSVLMCSVLCILRTALLW